MLDECRFQLFLSPVMAAEIETKVDEFLVTYSSLASTADSEGDAVFAVVPKHHYMWHWAQRAAYMNPRRGNTSIDEDFVGKMKEVCQRCTASTALFSVPSALMAKCRWGMQLERA